MSFLLYAIMVIAAAGMIFGLVQERRGATWGRPLTIACAVIALLMAVGAMVGGGGGGVDVDKIRKREAAYQKIAAQRMGQYLAENFSGMTALVVKPIEFGEPSDAMKAQLEGLEEGLGNQVEIAEIVSPEIPEEFRQMMEQSGADMQGAPIPPMADMSMLQADSFNAAVDDMLDDVDLVISLVGSPMDMENLSLWQGSDPPKLAVYGFPQMPGIKEAIEGGYIVAFVTNRPDPDPEANKEMPKGLEDFENRYILITPENVRQLTEDYPNLLPAYQQ